LPRVTLRSAVSVLMLAGICALPIALYAPFFNEPFMRDEGLYATVAQIIKHGGVPYQDHFDNKPPLIFGWYYLSFALFGEHVWAPRLLAALLLSGTAFLVYIEGRLLFSRVYGLASAFAFALSFGIVTLQTSANTEVFMLPPLVGALVAFTLGQQTGRWWWFVLAGFLSGIAIATKDISLFSYVFFLGLAAWPHLRERGIRAVAAPGFLRSVGGLIGGCFVAFVLVVAPFAATGSLPELFETTVVYTLKYVGGPPLSTKLGAMLTLPVFMAFIFGPWMILSVLGVFHIKREGAQGHGPLLVGWLAANLVGIVVAGRFYNHYFVALLPCLSLIVPLGLLYIARNWQSTRQARWLPLAATLILVLPLVAALQVAQNAAIFLKPTPAERHIARYSGDDRAPWENEGSQLGSWIHARTQRDDLIYNFGFQSELYFYADRRPATRFLMDRPFWYSDSYVDEALTQLNANKPAYVIDSAIYEKWANGKVYTQEIKDWIVENYDYVGKIYYADVWRLKVVKA
jgi:4-amino-4-deoxy-L-arabinose transferase-like glycosyltransferase